MMVFQRVDPFAIRTNSVEIVSFEVTKKHDGQEAKLVLKALESADYQFGLFNKSGMPTSCEYSVFTIE